MSKTSRSTRATVAHVPETAPHVPSAHDRLMAAYFLASPEVKDFILSELQQMTACNKPCAPVVQSAVDLRRELEGGAA